MFTEIDSSLKACGMTNHLETTVIWEEEAGKPINKVLVWQSRQSQYSL